LTWVERNFGFATAQAYAGHEDHGRGGKAMATYVRAGLPEVATALAALAGEDHPLAVTPPSRGVPIPRPPEWRRYELDYRNPLFQRDALAASNLDAT
jgi:hypothetical protein